MARMLPEGDYMPQADKRWGQTDGPVPGKQRPCSKLHLWGVGGAVAATPELLPRLSHSRITLNHGTRD